MTLDYFNTEDFHSALRTFFQNLNIPVNYIAEEPVRPQDILSDTFKPDHEAFRLMNDVYFLGMVDDAAFEGNASLAPEKIKSDYDGILIFGVTLHPRDNGLLPTRSQLAGITRAFNREFHYTPVVVVFKYDNHIAFANAERLKYKQEWREGEKAGKVSLLRDIDPVHLHPGHRQILSELAISRSGTKAVNSFADLYNYWQTVFNVSLLNKKFYEELSNWYFWAIKEVTFPSEPNMESLFKETGKADEDKLQELKQEHRAKNVIRLLTRFLFVWFIKEKKLIPEVLFDSAYLQKEILKDLSPLHEDGLFKSANIQSHYYKAILQNLFFATLNCPVKSERGDKRNRGFSKGNFGVLYLMRYEDCFKNTDLFLEMVNEVVPFLNGGLFECLDKRGEKEKKEDRIYIDGFSDNLPKEHELIVPDYLFFGLDEAVDLSPVIGIANKKTKQAAVKGLINIFESYKFTIAENTPVEEDIALDPELLGKVFENLLASYNPETKTTARKQTGSFYTPREIVNYMVDESLIAYLKNKVEARGMPEEELDTKLHQLFSFDAINPFADNQPLQTAIIKAIDHCTVLDPACGSGAFPMGVLQKMVHVLQKVDPDNEHWYELQMEKALQETESAFHLADKETRKQKLIEINEAFDRQVNDPDYARKLFLIEDRIYGVDIQPIAAQISKLRFFISLVVDQKVDKTKDNFGIRPLPNLETKFVAANTLVGIEKPEKERNLFENKEIEKLEAELKDVRHRIFSIKTPARKMLLREKDKELREKIGKLLIADGWGNKTASQLAGWDPYDQNASSSFFDPERMFGMKDGFDVVIGNPPYIGQKNNNHLFRPIKESSLGKFHQRRMDYYYFFIHQALNIAHQNSIISFITTNYFPTATYADKLRKDIKKRASIFSIVNFNESRVFETALGQHNMTFFLRKGYNKEVNCKIITSKAIGIIAASDLLKIFDEDKSISITSNFNQDNLYYSDNDLIKINLSREVNIRNDSSLNEKLLNVKSQLQDYCEINTGIQSGADRVTNNHIKKFKLNLEKDKGIFVLDNEELNALSLSKSDYNVVKPWYKNSDISKWVINKNIVNNPDNYVLYINHKCHTRLSEKIIQHFEQFKPILINRNTRSGTGVLSIGDYDDFVEGRKYVSYVMVASAFQEGRYYCISYARDPEIFEGPKIVSPQRSYSNTFGYTEAPFYASADVYFITAKAEFSGQLKYFLSILNSKLIYYYLYNFGKRKGDSLELYLKPLQVTPIIYDPEFIKPLETLVDIIIFITQCSGSKNDFFDSVINGLVNEIYFSDHMKEKQIDIMQFVEKDLVEVMQGREFEQLPDSEKENIIYQLHARWLHPDSEVRNRIKLFAVRSPDILKPILESR